MKNKTAFQKIIDSHTKKTLPDGRLVLGLDWVWCHEITTPNAILDAQARGCDVVFDLNKVKTMIDHINPAKDTASAVQGKIVREWSKKHNVEFLDVGRNGVCHAIIPEKGWIRPGQIGIMGDSHTCTHSAFCAFTAGVGTTDLEGGIVTGLWICPPQKVIRVNFNGKLPANVFAKDLILSLINKIGVKGGTNAVLEFRGSVIDEMSMEARMTITNMAIEAGATSGMMMVDKKTVDYLWPVLKNEFKDAEQALAELSKWNSDDGAEYAQVVDIDVSKMEPVITQNCSPGDVVSVREAEGKKINQVYIGSCTNGRLEDLRIAAGIFKKMGGKVSEDVRCIVVPATQYIYNKAMEEGLLKIFTDAGCFVSGPTCGACLGMSCGVLAPGEVCVSTTNRNFPGRMGKDGMVHLASPATAVLSALKGVITSPSKEICESIDVKGGLVSASPNDWAGKPAEKINYGSLAKMQSGSGKNFSGKAFYINHKNIDTDQIIPAKYLTETDKAEFGKHCMEDADISSEDRIKLSQSQIIVAGENFGCGSSREHAVWAFESSGIRCIIAPSFARIFYNNMFNNGLLCIELPQNEIDNLFKKMPDEIQIDLQNNKIITGDLNMEFKLADYQKELIQKGGSMGALLEIAAEVN